MNRVAAAVPFIGSHAAKLVERHASYRGGQHGLAAADHQGIVPRRVADVRRVGAIAGSCHHDRARQGHDLPAGNVVGIDRTALVPTVSVLAIAVPKKLPLPGLVKIGHAPCRNRIQTPTPNCSRGPGATKFTVDPATFVVLPVSELVAGVPVKVLLA